MSAFDPEEEQRALLARMMLSFRRERRRSFEYNGFIPKLIKEFFRDATFHRQFGINPVEFEELYNMLEDKIHWKHSRSRDNIGSRERLAICLRYLASGRSLQNLSSRYNMASDTVAQIVREVCHQIATHLVPKVMPEPTADMWQKNAQQFKDRFNMPNCIGALDGKSLMVNGQKIVFLAVVDASDRFVMVDVGNYRIKCFRGNVMDKSVMGRRFMKNQLNVPDKKPLTSNSEPLPFMVIASSLFPPKPYLMIKYSRAECNQNDTNKVFNRRVSRARRTVKRALKRLSKNWRVFRDPISIDQVPVEPVLLSCCCLHNYFSLRTHRPAAPPNAIVAITRDRLEALLKLLPDQSRDIRHVFKKYFLSPEGQVPWQWQDILT